jgi:dGTPase
LKVAQVGRRLVEYIKEGTPESTLTYLGGVDPDVVEAAALAHDLGHPPFGHAAEETLQECMEHLVPGQETFEGNAQSFRVATHLAVRFRRFGGLNLTRATLNGLLKYPWFWATGKTKWGAYQDQETEFRWARRPLPARQQEKKAVEAEIMDLSDDIAYAVHDIEDFYRAGLVPLHTLAKDDVEVGRFCEDVFSRRSGALPYSQDDLKSAFRQFLDNSPVIEAYTGSHAQRAALRSCTSRLIGTYIRSATLKRTADPGKRLEIPSEYFAQIFMLKELTWYYVIMNPGLKTQQYGQKKIIKGLFDFYNKAAIDRDGSLLPVRGKEMLQPLIVGTPAAANLPAFCARLASDIVASLTEQEAVSMYHRIAGISPGSVFDFIA